MVIHFVDTNSKIVEALKSAFCGFENVEFECDNILSVAKGALVSPANSYGFMDGGIDEEYIDFFGMDLQNAVRDRIDRLGGSLPIGSAFTLNTKNEKIPYLIVTPTMELPGAVPAHNCYFAMGAILQYCMLKDKRNGGRLW